ncbi:hypothetical protein AD998_14325 [bacterium 336/3]|nr:hypothetical protein AD998_14325 [bacterium 336/3]
MTQEERQQKFELFVEAMNVPLEIRTNKLVSRFSILPLLTFLFMLIGIVLVPFSIINIKFIYGSITLIISSILILVWFLFQKGEKEKKIEMIINYNGIDTHEVGFWGWDDISDEHIRYDKSTEHPKSYLCYECPNGSVRILLSDYEECSGLGFYLKQYREFHYIKKNTFNL